MPVYNRTNIPASVGRGTLDPELKAWLPKGPTLGADVAIAQGRRDHKMLGEGVWPEIGAVETLVLPGPHGSLAVRKHTPTSPTSAPPGALVYLHGGGFTYGTLDEFEVPMRLLAERAGIVTYAIDYQLAPEAKFPVQIDEIEYFVRWLFYNAGAQGVDASKIAVGGDSAGGNMTCVIALKLRDEAGPKLALQVPLFPEAAFPGDTLSGSENRTGLYLETNGIYEMVRNYIKNSDEGRHPHITPLNAASQTGLPSTILVTNGFDPLRDVGHASLSPGADGHGPERRLQDARFGTSEDGSHTRKRPDGYERGASRAMDARIAVSATSLICPPSSTVVAASSRSPPSSMTASCRGTGPTPAARICSVSQSAWIMATKVSVMSWRHAGTSREGTSRIQLNVMAGCDWA
jgi:acetyl esterase/lipase